MSSVPHRSLDSYAVPLNYGGDQIADLEASQSLEDPIRMRGTTWHSGLPVDWSDGRDWGVERSKVDLVAKRVIDILGAIAGIAILAPLLVLVALAIKISSPGPVLFRQKREGLNGCTFEALKFRSMRLDGCDLTGLAQTQTNDLRITLVGRFIRKTSIDELPQLFNVLRGDMSLVGPRPHVTNMMAAGQPYRDLVSYYDRRLVMRPGLTGWAQANGLRGETGNRGRARERIDHDLAYIQNFSIWLDLRILMRTLAREFLTGTGD